MMEESDRKWMACDFSDCDDWRVEAMQELARRSNAQCVWQAMQALVFGALMYEVGFDDGEVDRKPKYRPVNRWAGQ